MSVPTQPSITVAEAHAASIAHRLLAGAGTASVVAFRRDPGRAVAVAAHGLTPAGDIVVCHRGDDVPEGASDTADVRLDIRREAAEAQVRVLAATVHLLGRIEWFPTSWGEDLVRSGRLPRSVSPMVGVPGSVLGVVRTERVVVHAGAGISPLTVDEVLAAGRQGIYPAACDEFEAQEIVAGLEPDALYGIYGAALSGRLRGEVLSERPGPPACGATVGRIYCVDVDALGLTLMHVGATATTVVFAPFPEPVRDHAQLRACVRRLLP